MRRLLVVLLVVTGFVAVEQVSGASPVAAAGGVYQAVNPARVTDTRSGFKIDDKVSDPKGIRKSGSTLTVPIVGRGGVPKGAAAVTVNLTATGSTNPGFLRVYPCGTKPPSSSSLNLQPGVDVANSVFTKLGTKGDICIYSQGSTHVIVDITGYVPGNASPSAVNPARVTDTRNGYEIDDTVSDPKGIRKSGSTLTVPIIGRGGVPKGASAVIVNLTATGTTTPGYLRVYPCGATPPTSSSLNLLPGVDVANSVFTKLGTKGDICIYSQGNTDVIVDITGYVPAKASPTPVDPARVTDTRAGYKIDDTVSDPKGIRTSGSTLTVPIAGRGEVPKNASGVIINLTATGTTTPGYLRVYPCGTTAPTSSSLNLRPGVDVANTVFTKLGTKGDICIFSQGNTHVIVDITGHIAPNTPACASSTTSIPKSECNALVKLYESTGGPKWFDRSGWNTATDPCTWARVTCENSHVVGLSFLNNNLTGSIPSSISELKYLRGLGLGANRITSLPATIGSLQQLQGLYLNDTSLTSLPVEVANLTSLRDLFLSGSKLTSLPPALGRLQLSVLAIGDLGLTRVPEWVPEMNTLMALFLDDNPLETVTSDLKKLSTLQILSLKATGLSAVPDVVLEMAWLNQLILSSNQITSLPPNINRLAQLQSLVVSSNQLSTLPDSFAGLRDLGDLNLSENQFTTLPTPITKLPNLVVLRMGSNQIGTLPADFGKLTGLFELDLSNNRISGDVTAAFEPIRVANRLDMMSLRGNGCMKAGPDVAKWLSTLDPSWNAGC